MNQIKVLVDIIAETNHKGEKSAEVRKALAESLKNLADSLLTFAENMEKEVKNHGNLI